MRARLARVLLHRRSLQPTRGRPLHERSPLTSSQPVYPNGCHWMVTEGSPVVTIFWRQAFFGVRQLAAALGSGGWRSVPSTPPTPSHRTPTLTRGGLLSL